MKRTWALLSAGRFAVARGETTAGTQVVHLSVSIVQVEVPSSDSASAGAFGLGFEPPSPGRAGKGFFTLASGRRVEIAVKLVKVSH